MLDCLRKLVILPDEGDKYPVTWLRMMWEGPDPQSQQIWMPF